MAFAVFTDFITYFSTSKAALAYGEFTGGTVAVRSQNDETGWQVIG